MFSCNPVQQDDIATSFSGATESAEVGDATTDTSPQSFSTFTVPQLSIWLTSTIKNIPQSVLTEIENNEIDGGAAIDLSLEGLKDLGLSNIQSAKVISGTKKFVENGGS